MKVSVIVPVYRVAAYLDRCVTSLTQQTLSDIEILLVDDGSPDECPALCDRWAERDSRIRVIHRENGGLGMARNTGLAAARGEFIGFVDSDDYVHPKMLETLYRAATVHGAQIALSGLCCLGGVMVSQPGAVQILHNFEEETVFDGPDEIGQLMLAVSGALPREREDSRYGFSCVKNLYEARIIRENNLHFLSEREVMSEDICFLLDFLLVADRAIGVPGAYYYYCRNGASLSKRYRSDRFAACLNLLAAMEARLGRRLPPTVYRRYTDRLVQAYARAACMQEIQFAASNGLSGRELNRRLRTLCQNETLQRVLRRYPWYQLPPTQAVFALTMRFSLVHTQQMLVKLKSKGS